MLRREGLFSSQLTTWRKQYHAGARQALSQRRGPKPRADTETMERLQRENDRLRDQLARAELVISIQKTIGAAGAAPTSRRESRAHMTATLQTHGNAIGMSTLSGALGVPRSSAYRWLRPPAPPLASDGQRDGQRDGQAVARAPSPRALSPAAQTQVLAYLRDPRFVDRAPAQVYATLLDEGTFVCSVRTMYRLLATFHEVRARRAQRVHPPYAVPRLVARQPNQVWTWDVTDLRGPTKSERYKLYVVLDLFSRYVVAWMLARRESARLAQRLIRTACAREGIVPGQLTTHSDRGSIQVAKDLHDLYQDRGIVRSLLVCALLSPLQPRAPPRRHCVAHARHRPRRPDPHRPRAATARSGCRLSAAPGTLRQRATPRAPPACPSCRWTCGSTRWASLTGYSNVRWGNEVPNARVPFDEVRRIAQSWRALGVPSAAIVYERNGQRHEVADVFADSAIRRPLPFVVRKLFAYRAVEADEKESRCRW